MRTAGIVFCAIMAERMRMKRFFITMLAGAMIFPALAAEAKPERAILGIHLDMARDAARKRLQEIGKFERDERKRQEIWKVDDKSFSHVIVGFDKNDTLRYVTAVAREDKEAQRVAYSEIGDLKQARQAGDPKIKNFNYEWDLPAEKRDPEGVVSARGRDEKFLTTYSLKRTSAAP